MKRLLVTLALFGFAACGSTQELKDPTLPPLTTAAAHRQAAAPRPRVTGIFISAQRRVATFDDRPVHVGDRVGDCIIEAITSAGVRYRSQGLSSFAALTVAAP
jgi:flagellar basal body L-ring protein FlgH